MYNITNILTIFCKVYLRLYPYYTGTFIRFYPYSLFRIILNLLII